ncbi:hypothetical protein C8R43DRAFT_1138739 [Mycena crocata]|nr:hypothetical protein C8R43DRAFT_1138739 [Mycena crocata]
MPPNGWTTDNEFAFLWSQIPEYIKCKANGTFWKFWPVFYAEWFRRFPEEARLGFGGVTAEGDAIKLTAEQEVVAGKALEKRKQQLETWFRWHSKKVNKPAVAQNKADYSLGNEMFKKKLPRRRAHRPRELFQKRNKALVDDALDVEGFFEVNEAHRVASLADLADETEEEKNARMKAAQAERMNMRTRVVDRLFSEASEDELRCINELIEGEQQEIAAAGNGKKKNRQEQREQDEEAAAREPTPEEYQMAIDESPEVMARVHEVLAKRTGWYGITIYGGPNPRYGGGLSMKSVCFGRTLAGNDFETAHTSFDHSISKYFQAFLKRSFPTEVRRARALQQLADTVDATLPALDGLFRLPDEEILPPPAPRTKPKRIRTKTKKNPGGVPVPAPAPSSAPSTGGIPVPSPAPISPTLNSSAAAPASMSPISTSIVHASPNSPPNSSPQPDYTSSYGLDSGSARAGPQNRFDDDPFYDSSQEQDNAPPWPAGMGPPSSPRTAEANASAERGMAHGTTYRHAARPSSPPIDPALLQLHGSTRPNGPRPAWRGVLGSVPASPTRTSNVMGFNFPTTVASTSTPASQPPSGLNNLINRFHHIMDVPRPDVASTLSLAISPHPAMVSLNSPARISRISSTVAGASQVGESLPAGSQSTTVEAPSNEATPFQISSRPMANDPNPPKKVKAGAAQEKTGRGRGGGRKRSTDAVTKEAAAKQAAKAPATRGRKKGKSAAGAAARDADGALDDTTNLDNEHDERTSTPVTSAAPVPAAPVPAAPTLIYSATNNSAVYAKMARKEEAEKKAREIAARKERARVHNPDGPSDLVILPGRGQRARKPTKNFDGSAVALEKKMTRAEQQAKRNEPSENALLARTGRKRGAEDPPSAPSRAAKK